MTPWKTNEIIYNNEVTRNKFQHRFNITQLLISCCVCSIELIYKWPPIQYSFVCI